MEFYQPAILWLSLAIPALLYIRHRRKGTTIPFPGLSGMALPKARFRGLPTTILALAAVMLIVSAARPRVQAAPVEENLRGVDVALALDVSGSMRAEDFKPNRMEAAKARVKEFVKGFHEGRMALVAFAGRSFTQCPLTTDGGILEGLIDQLDVGSVEIDGTAIGDAIINCINKFKEEAGSRVIILLTDGENNAGTVDPVSAARAAAAKGIKVYTIGVGTPEGAPIPMTGPSGEKFYLKDPMGNLVLAKVDEATLRQIADISGGTYFRATDDKALGDIYKKISAMEKSAIKVKRHKNFRELFPYAAGAGLILILLGGALSFGRYRVLD